MTNKEKIETLKKQLILHPSYLNIVEEIEKDLKCGETCKKMLNMILQSFKVSIDRFKNSFKNEREFEMFKGWLEK